MHNLWDSQGGLDTMTVVFDIKLTFVEHISNVCNKAFKIIGFLSRHAKDSHNIYALRALYTSLVRSHLEN